MARQERSERAATGNDRKRAATRHLDPSRDELIAIAKAAMHGVTFEDAESQRRRRVEAIAGGPGAPRSDRAVCMLAHVELRDEDHAAAFLGRFAKDGVRPGLKDLRNARVLLEWIDLALTKGTPAVWRQIQRARNEVEQFNPRLDAIAALRQLVTERNQLDPTADLLTNLGELEGDEFTDDDRAVATATLQRVSRRRQQHYDGALRRCAETLRVLDPAFEKLSIAKLGESIRHVKDAEPRRGRGNQSIYTALATISVDCRAFDRVASASTRVARIRAFASDLSKLVAKPKRVPAKSRA